MRRGRTRPSEAVSFMDKPARHSPTQAETVLISKLLHAADRLLALGNAGRRLAVRKPSNGSVEEFIYRPEQPGLDGVLKRPFLFRIELNGHGFSWHFP